MQEAIDRPLVRLSRDFFLKARGYSLGIMSERLLDKISLDLMSANGRTPMAKTLKNNNLVF